MHDPNIQTSKQNCNNNRSIALSNFICLKNQASFIDQLAGWRNWIAHLTTDQEVPGSSPGSVDTFVFIFLIFLRGVCDWYFHCTCTNWCDTVHQFYIVSLYSSVYVHVYCTCMCRGMDEDEHATYLLHVHVCMSEVRPMSFHVYPFFLFLWRFEATSSKVYNCLPTPPRSSINRPAGVIG